VRVGGFSCGDDDGLYTDEREGGVDEGRNESCEISRFARESVRLCPCSRVVPVAESTAVVIGSSSESDDETNNNLDVDRGQSVEFVSTREKCKLTRPRKQRTLIIDVTNSDSP